ncbi:MAG: (2Fe-2S)-binding protein [Gaiellales bacterium]
MTGIAFTLNGSERAADVRADTSLLTVLRGTYGLLSARETCGIGVCGSCSVLLDGEPVASCILLAPMVDGRSVTTAESLDPDDPVLEAFAEAHAFQCGFCTPGFALTVKRLLEENPSPSVEETTRALAGNLCRCGSYLKILDAVELAARRLEAPSS